MINTLRTGIFKPTTLTCALYTLKINIKSPNSFYEVFGEHLPVLIEVLESDISGNIPFVKWHYTELADVNSHTPLFVNCANTALPRRMLLLGMFTLHKGIFPHIT
jgi:hypothetical protein